MPAPIFPRSEPAALPADAWAWLDGGNAGKFAASGPFRHAADPGGAGLAFYVNDFQLSDPAPWRIPLQPGPPGEPPAAPPPRVTWQPPSRDAFAAVFRDLMLGVRTREILKAVPVAVAGGRIESGLMGPWMRHLLSRRPPEIQGLPFAWIEPDRGFGGFTPEILFQIDGCRLTTMALAGTTDADHAAELTERPKLAREHAVVVDELQRRLRSLGKVTTGTREIVRQGTLHHLRTPLEVTLEAPPGGAALNAIIQLLHPTPALGISPRNTASLARLHACRTAMGTPPAFGAPFGVVWPGGALFVVAIRGAFWERRTVLLPSGCGLVAGSEFEAEWAELELKRAWVRRALGLEAS